MPTFRDTWVEENEGNVTVDVQNGEFLHFQVTAEGKRGSINFGTATSNFWTEEPAPKIQPRFVHQSRWPQVADPFDRGEMLCGLQFTCTFPSVGFDARVNHCRRDGSVIQRILKVSCRSDNAGDSDRADFVVTIP